MKKRLFEQFDEQFMELCQETCLDRLKHHDRVCYLLNFLLSSGLLDSKKYCFLRGALRAVCFGQ